MQEQSYPSHPGSRGLTEATRETSREAADKIAPLAKTQSEKVLAELLDAFPEGRSSEQIAATTGIRVHSVRSRISGLFASGKVVLTDQRAKNGDGNSVVVWRAVND
jgi:DNA-directed RNA polymerase specialized sigma24 family protein